MKALSAIALLAPAVAAFTFAAPAPLPAEPSHAARSARNMSYYEVRRGLFAMSKIQTAPIVMLGDSLTEAGPWTDLTGCLSIANRGIGGDTTKRVLERLDEVLALTPRAVFLMVGVNDLTLSVPHEATVGNLRAILGRLTATDAQTFLTYVLPVTASYPKKRLNGEIAALDAAIGKLVVDQPKITAIDPRSQLTGPGGHLREEFAYDGMHLTPQGYAVLRDAIAPHVAKYCVR